VSLNNKPKVTGFISYYGLENWWFSSFKEDERHYIKQTYQPLGGTDQSLTEGEIGFANQSIIMYLSVLASWFRKANDRSINFKILQKASEYVTEASDVLDLHFLYQTEIESFYKFREDEAAFEEAIRACKSQINISPKAKAAFQKEFRNAPLPSHKGYEQLATIEEKRKNYKRAIDLSAQALDERWAGDWVRRIERCKNKLLK
jgi:hypothetical protein